MISLLKAFQENRFLIGELLKQNLFTQYKQSRFSFFWIVFNPFFQIIVWSVLHFSGFLQVGLVQVPYIIYLVAGIILWWYSFSLYESISTIYTRYTNIILENRFDILVLVWEAIFRQSVFFLIHLSVLFVLCMYYKIHFYSIALLYPFLLIPLLLFSISLGLFFAVFRVLAVDLAMIFDKLVGLLFFVTPILYKATFDHVILKWIVRLNPFSYLIVLPRNVLLYGRILPYQWLAFAFVFSFSSFIVSLWYFKRMQYKTIEKLLQ